MRAGWVCLVLITGWTGSGAGGETDSAPTVAYVQAEGASVLSGPGDNFYPTAQLRSGDKVEIYRRDPGGWCAIRPVAGSFSYVNARNVTPAGEKLVRVNADRVPARVGSVVTDARDAIHVYLKQNETLEVLGTTQDGQGETWLKISPPAGEFRWIHERFLGSEAPSRYEVKLIQSTEPSGPRLQLNNDTTGEWMAVDGGNRVPAGSANARTDLTGARSEGGLAGGALQWELDQIDVSLGRIMSDPPERWNFGPIRLQTQGLQDRNLNAAERSRVQAMLNKIDRYEDLRRRSTGVTAMRDDLERRFRPVGVPNLLPPVTNPMVGRQPAPGVNPLGPALINPNAGAPLATIPYAAAPPAVTDPSQFDAVGRLTPVVSKRKNAPTFALMDASRNVVAFITPAPGIDLRGLLGQEIGVQGERGYIPEFQRMHVTAQRASPIRY